MIGLCVVGQMLLIPAFGGEIVLPQSSKRKGAPAQIQERLAVNEPARGNFGNINV